MIELDEAAEHGEQLLELSGIVKQFTGTLALDHVDFDVRRGEIHALLGQNGAGKSTLIKIMAGIYPPTEGRMRWRGQDVVPGDVALPITFIHQDLGLVDTMTVAENVAILTGYPRRRGLIDWAAAATAARKALDRMGSSIDPETRVGTLSAADKSIVAIARALARRCDLLVLDEPTAALPAADVDLLLGTLQRLKESGIGLLYVTHRLDEVFRIADRLTVLRDGRRIATRPIPATSQTELVEWIVGGTLTQTSFAVKPASETVLMSLDDVVVSQDDGAGRVGPVSLVVRRGETLGLVGLRGAGHHALGRALFGALPIESGTVLFKDKPLKTGRPSRAIQSGIGFVSSRRGEESLAGALSVLENLFINSRTRGVSPLRPIAPRQERKACGTVLARFSVRPPDPTPAIATLSGGNQQKVVVARWLESQVDLLILEEPTIGVDVGSKAEIYRDLDLAHANGRAVLLISSDFEEIEKVCHRALVFNRGTVTAEIAGPEITVARLTALAAGADPVTEAAA
ncbi:sugar ABC transporter ATP-binding protein [Lichenihabitans psoromatis]|uniref:sugar ABC transporter ATP-binding protein n=1 Tax=Lichenihabitans psoromatis TaxID=2528642 RepID=UPI001FDFE3EE|nr:sugar ABC transporter ATP-binding protein [Lichenihabitans psoromatis]